MNIGRHSKLIEAQQNFSSKLTLFCVIILVYEDGYHAVCVPMEIEGILQDNLHIQQAYIF